MARRKFTAVVALLAAGALGLTACARGEAADGNSNESAETPDYVTPAIHEQDPPGEPTAGGTLTLADYAETRSLDPSKTIATGYSGGTALVAVYDQLLRWNVREQDFEYRLATAVEPNEDHTQWTITLREGVQFSDGTPFNADAVIGSMNYYAENQGYDMGVIGPLWAGAEKIDELTVQVNLTDSWATFPFALGLGMGFIAAPAAIENGPDNFEPIGAGAFVYESYSPQEELVLAKNPSFWEGEPYLDKLRMVWLGADETKSESVATGAAHVAMLRDITLIKQLRDDDASGWIHTENLGNVVMVNYADGRPAAQDPRIAQAIAHAIDEESWYDRNFDGLGVRSKNLFGPQSRWYNEDAETREYDPQLAEELLDEAKADGFDGKIGHVAQQTPSSRDQALTFQAQLEAVGFTVENEFMRTVSDYTSRVVIERDYDFSRSSLSLSDHDPYWRLFGHYHSESPMNSASFADPEFDALIEELRATEGEDRREVLHRIDDAFSDKLPSVNFAGNVNFNMWADNVHGVQPIAEAMMGFEKAWIAS